MNEKLKAISIIAAAMVVTGLTISVVALAFGARTGLGWNDRYSRTLDESQINRGGERLAEFSSIDLNLDLYQLTLEETDGEFAISYAHDKRMRAPSYGVENGKLYFQAEQYRKFGINLPKENCTVKISYPKGTKFNYINIDSDLGDLFLSGLQANRMEIGLDMGRLVMDDVTANTISVSVDAGDCALTNLQADNLEVEADLGKVELTDFKVENKLTVSASAGDVRLSEGSAGFAELSLDLGDLEATRFDSNGLTADADLGNMEITGNLRGKSTISMSLGSVEVNPTGAKSDYSLNLNVSLGSIDVDGNSYRSQTYQNDSAPNSIIVESDAGDINVRFGNR